MRNGSKSAKIISHGGGMVSCTLVHDLTERKRVEAEINQRDRELTSLLDASLRLASQLDIEELLNTIVASVINTLPAAEAASLWLYDEEHNELAAHAWAGHNDNFFYGFIAKSEITTQLPPLIHYLFADSHR